MSLLIISGELMFTSRVSAAAQAAGKSARAAFSAAKALDLLAETPYGTVCVDLSAPGVRIETLVTEIRAAVAPNAVLIVAFAPHVHEDKLAQAQAAGCDVVYTRGQFDKAIPQLIQG